MVVIGGSGTGKSVLLKCILGLVDAGWRRASRSTAQDVLKRAGA